MRTLQINDVSFSLPGSWNELSKADLLALATMDLKRNMSVEEIKIKMLFLTMGAHVTHHKANNTYTLVCRKNKFDLTSTDVLAMASIFDFLFTENETGAQELHSKLTKNPYPVLPCKCSSRLIGSEDGLVDLTYEQAIEAESYRYKFLHSQKPEDLHRFVSALYHTGNRFDINKLKDNAKKFVSHASPACLHVVHFYWCGCMDMIAELYPNCFSAPNSDEPLPERPPFSIHRDIIYKLADGDIVKETAIEQLELHRVYGVLNKKIEEDEKLREEIEKLTTKR